MARVLAFSDAQLGAGADYGRQPGERLADQRQALVDIAAAASEHRAGLILFCGDAFQHRRPSAPELDAWRLFLKHAPCPVLAIAGNHDCTGPMAPTSLNVYVGQPGYALHTFPNVYEGQGVQVATLPWAHPGTERAALGGAVSPAETADRLVGVAAGLRARCGPHALLALHWAISECSLPGGLPTGALTEPVLPLEALLAQGWHAIAAGHVHKAQRPRGLPNVVVCGSPYVCDFGEAQLQHGYWLLDTDTVAEAPPTWVLHELPGREFITWDVDLTSREAQVLAASDVDSVKGAVVKVRYTATEEQARQVDQAQLKRDLYAAGAHKVYAIEATVVRSERPRAAAAHERMEPAEALAMWLKGQDGSLVHEHAVREQGLRYIEEVR